MCDNSFLIVAQSICQLPHPNSLISDRCIWIEASNEKFIIKNYYKKAFQIDLVELKITYGVIGGKKIFNIWGENC